MPADTILRRLANEARDLGFLGPGPPGMHLEHAQAFGAVVEASGPSSGPARALDLGSGAGVPGLVLAVRWETSTFVLVESRARRSAFLLHAVEELGLGERVRVLAERAEIVGHTLTQRGGFDLVTARSFARPAVVAECAAPLLGVGGLLVVSEPPGEPGDLSGRWPRGGLAELGLGDAESTTAGYRFVVVRQRRPCPSRFPRRVGIPAKRPLF